MARRLNKTSSSNPKPHASKPNTLFVRIIAALSASYKGFRLLAEHRRKLVVGTIQTNKADDCLRWRLSGLRAYCVNIHSSLILIEPITTESPRPSLLLYTVFRTLFSLQRERHGINKYIDTDRRRAERARVPSSKSYRLPIWLVATYRYCSCISHLPRWTVKS